MMSQMVVKEAGVCQWIHVCQLIRVCQLIHDGLQVVWMLNHLASALTAQQTLELRMQGLQTMPEVVANIPQILATHLCEPLAGRCEEPVGSLALQVLMVFITHYDQILEGQVTYGDDDAKQQQQAQQAHIEIQSPQQMLMQSPQQMHMQSPHTAAANAPGSPLTPHTFLPAAASPLHTPVPVSPLVQNMQQMQYPSPMQQMPSPQDQQQHMQVSSPHGQQQILQQQQQVFARRECQYTYINIYIHIHTQVHV